MPKIRTRTLLIAGAVLAIVLAGVVSFYASQDPDGLEKVASDKGMDHKVEEHRFADGPLSDYGVKGVDDERISGGLAGILGVGATLLVGTGIFWVVKRRGPGPDGKSRDHDGTSAGGTSEAGAAEAEAPDSGACGGEARTTASASAAPAASSPEERP